MPSAGLYGLTRPSGEGVSQPWSRKWSRRYGRAGGVAAPAVTSVSHTPRLPTAARSNTLLGAILPTHRSSTCGPGSPGPTSVHENVAPLQTNREPRPPETAYSVPAVTGSATSRPYGRPGRPVLGCAVHVPAEIL